MIVSTQLELISDPLLSLSMYCGPFWRSIPLSVWPRFHVVSLKKNEKKKLNNWIQYLSLLWTVGFFWFTWDSVITCLPILFVNPTVMLPSNFNCYHKKYVFTTAYFRIMKQTKMKETNWLKIHRKSTNTPLLRLVFCLSINYKEGFQWILGNTITQ